MEIIGILIAIIIPTIILSLVVGGIYLMVRKKNEQGAPEHPIHFHEIILHLFQLSLLVANVFALLTIVFTAINKLFPDLLSMRNIYAMRQDSSSLHTAVALLAVTLPGALIVGYLSRSMLEKDPAFHTSPVRKYGIGMTLVVSGLSICGAIFSTIFQFLEGDLSGRFFAKAASVFLIGGVLFLYYRYLYKATKEETVPATKAFAVFASIVLVSSAVYGIILTGSPAEIRREKFDDRRLQDLSSIQNQIISYWQNHKMLPENLALLTDALSSFAVPTDPKTSIPYAYRIVTQSTGDAQKKITAATFELCGTFETVRKTQGTFEGVSNPNFGQTDKGIIVQNSLEGYYIDQETPFWNHPKGNFCFTRTIDPKIYSPIYPAMPIAEPMNIQ